MPNRPKSGCLGPNEDIAMTKSTEAITLALRAPEPSAENTREGADWINRQSQRLFRAEDRVQDEFLDVVATFSRVHRAGAHRHRRVRRRLQGHTGSGSRCGGHQSLRSHPIGATGAVLITRLIHSVRRDSLTRGLVTLCIGGGQGIALAIERMQ
jgi:hypothetical protein